MFSVLNNTLQLQGTNVVLPVSAVAIGTATASASLHIQQANTTTDSGILLQGPDNKKWTLNYNGTGLSFTEDELSRFRLMNGGNVDIGAALHISGDLQVDGSVNIFGGSLTTINTTSTLTHMMKVINNGTGPAITAMQLRDNQPTFEAYHGTVLSLQVASNSFVGITLPGLPSQALDVGGNINASGFSQATNFITVGSPVASNTGIGSTTGGYLAWNRNASGAVMLANAKGTLAGGWEFVSYNADGSFNKVPAIISDAGDVTLTGSGSLAGSLSVASNITGTSLNITGSYASVTGNMRVGSSLAAGSLSGTFSTIAGFAYVGSSLTVGSLMTSTALNITGPFASVAGNTAIGSNLTVGSLITATTLYIKGPYASIAGNISVGTNLVAGSVITSTALNVTGPYASIAGDTSVGSSLVVGSVITATALNVTGPYASISGFLSTGSTARLYNALVGDIGFGTSLAGFQHNSLSANQANYAMQQQSDGATYVNAASGKLLHFRNNNTTLANVSASGVRVGDSTAATYSLDVSGSSRIANDMFFGVRNPTGQGAWMVWNRTIGRGDTVFMNQVGNGSPGGFQFQNLNNLNVLQNTPLTILGSGLIGVSNTNPTVALDVIGQGLFSSTLTALNITGSTLAVTGSYMSVTGTVSIGGQLNVGSNLLSFTPGYVSNGSGSVSAANSVLIDIPGTGTISFSDTLMNYGMLGINCVPSYSIDVAGNLRATGNALVNSVSIGTVSGNTGAVFANNAMLSANNYALLQSATGQTIVNAPTGQAVLLRNNNVDIANFTPTGLRLGDASAAAYTLDVGGNANVQTSLSALNVAGTTLNVTGAFASVTGSLSVGSSFSVGTANPLTVLPGVVYTGTGTVAAPNSSFVNLAGLGTISFNDTIVNYGKIGVNTTTPVADLDIQGLANVSSTLTALNLSGTTLLVTGTYASILGNLTVGSSASISGNASIGTSLIVGSVITATALNVTGPYASIAGSVNIGTSLNVQGSGTFGGNVVVSGFVQASNFSAAGSNTGLAGNVAVGSNLTVGGTITGTALIITGSYASVAGNVQVGSLLTVGSLITSTALNVTGPYASIAGNTAIGSVLTVGSAASFLNNISVAGTILASNFLTVGSLASLLSNVQVSSNLTVLGSISGSSLNTTGQASIAGNTSIGSSLVVGSQISATALNITGPFASISGSVNIGSNVVIAGSLMATVLNIGGSYSSLAGGISVGGLITNNVFGNLHLKVYDESAVYNNVGAGSVGGALPAMFTSKPTLTLHANTINLTNQTFGTLTGKYSTRFAGYVQPPSTGTYSFRVTYQDGATLWIGVEKLINSWEYQSGIASSVTSLTMYANIWSPFSLEHTCATSAERLLVEWNLNGGSYSQLQHAAGNFQFAYELGDLPCTQLSTTYVSGQLFAGDSIVAQSGIVLPNSSVFTGATSQLYNDAGFVTYLGATNSASAASLTQLTASTITASSLSATLAYTSTLTVGTILNFSAGGTSINAVSGSISTLTVGSLVTNFLQASTLSAASINSTFLTVSTISATLVSAINANLVGSLTLGAAYGLTTLSSQTLTVLRTTNQTLNNTNAGGTTSYGQAFFLKAGDSVGNYWGGSPSVNAADLNIQAGNVNIGSANNGTAYVNGTGGFVRLYPGFASVTTTAAASSFNVNSGQIWLYSCNTNGTNQNPVYTPGLILNNFGNVGINTTTPTFQLDVSGSARFTGSVTASTARFGPNGAGQPSLVISDNGTGTARATIGWGSSTGNPANWVMGQDRNSSGSGDFYLYNFPNNTTPLFVTSTGSAVGINTTSPSYTLDVLSTSSADKPSINPDAANTLLIYEDCQATSLNAGVLTRNAVAPTASNKYIVLTSNVSSQFGQVYWNMNPGNAWTWSAEYYVGDGGTATFPTGGDAAVIYWSATALAGSTAHYTGVSGGYGVHFADYTGSTSPGGSGSIIGVGQNILLSYNGAALYQAPLNIPRSSWNQIKIVFQRNLVRAYLNNVAVITFQDINRDITGRFAGIAAGTGGAVNNHWVRNIRLSKYAEDTTWSQTGLTSNAICYNSGNVGINTAAPAYNLDISGSCRVSGGEIIGSISQAVFGPGNYGQVRMIGGTVGAIFRNDGVNCNLLFTNYNDAYGQWNSLRPFALNVSTGFLGLNQTNPACQLDVNGSARVTGSVTASALSTSGNISGGNYISTSNALGPSSINNEGVSGILNMSNNFREPTVNTAKVGAMFRIDNRPGVDQFSWITRAAGSTTETTVATLQNTGVLGVTGLNIPGGGKFINLGSDQTKSDGNAGKIGYQLFTSGAVDMVGASGSGGSRTIKLWDNVIVNGNLSFGGQPAQKAVRVWTGTIQGPYTGDWAVVHATVGLAGGTQFVEYSYSAFNGVAGNMGVALVMPAAGQPGGSYRGASPMYCNTPNQHTTAPTKIFQLNIGAGSCTVNFFADFVQYGNMGSDGNDFLYWRITEYPA